VVFAYTTNYLYKEMNTTCASNRHEKVMHIMGAVVRYVKETKDVMTKCQKVYRGVRAPTPQYEEGKEYYWPTFSSTSKAVSVAQGFAGEEKGTVFELSLSKDSGNLNVDIESRGAGWTFFQSEAEVLFLPYLHFRVTDISQQAAYRWIKIEEMKGVYAMSQEHVAAFWQDEIKKIKNQIAELVSNLELKFRPAFDLQNYFASVFENDYGEIFEKCYGENKALLESGWGQGLYNFITFGSDMRKFSNVLRDQCTRDIPVLVNQRIGREFENLQKEISRRVLDEISQELKKNIDRFPADVSLEHVFNRLDGQFRGIEKNGVVLNELGQMGFFGLILAIFLMAFGALGDWWDSLFASQEDRASKIRKNIWSELRKGFESSEAQSKIETQRATLLSAYHTCIQKLQAEFERVVDETLWWTQSGSL